jgi:hypothetical protein
MTLFERNTVFKVGIVFCAVIAVLILAASFFAVSAYPTIESSGTEDTIRRPENLFTFFTGWLFKNNFYAVHTSLVLSVLFSLTSLILIHRFFERTSVTEILYVSFFTISLSAEFIRLVLPLSVIHSFPLIYLLGASRLLLFARYFGVFSLFAASVCAAGLEIQLSRNVILTITIAALVITAGLPIDTQVWNTSLNIVYGYASMIRMIEVVIFTAAVLSFLIAAKIRGSKEYVLIAIGAAIALIGRNILLGADNWAGPVTGIALLTCGTGLVCSKLHKIHLWL